MKLDIEATVWSDRGSCHHEMKRNLPPFFWLKNRWHAWTVGTVSLPNLGFLLSLCNKLVIIKLKIPKECCLCILIILKL